MTTVILRTVTRVVVPVTLVVAAALFAQGHNLPGGGFVAGVLAATGVSLAYITYGLDAVERGVMGREPGTVAEHIEHGVVDEYESVLATGLAVAIASSLAAVLYGWLVGVPTPFFDQSYIVIHHVPLWSDVELASATVFDTGVFAVVVGALLVVVSVVSAE